MASVDDDPYADRGIFEQGFDANGTWFKLHDTDGFLIYTSPTYAIGWDFWVHYACSFNGNNFKYWINGILTYDIDIAEVINTSVEKICFGSLHMAFDEIRVSGAYRYTDDFAIPANPYTGYEPPLKPDPTLGLWHFDNSVVGEVGLPWTTSSLGIISTKAHTGFDVGVLMDTFCFINYALEKFDSTGYTIEMFGSPTVDTGAPIRARTGLNGGGGDFTILSTYNKNTGFISITWRDTLGGTIASGSGTVAVLEWCHLAIQFNDTVIEFYCNGELLSSTDHTVGGKTPRGIGSITQDSVENCYLDEYRISRGFVYSGATYTIPTEPFTLPPSDYDY